MSSPVDILLVGNDPDLSSSFIEIFTLFGLSSVHHSSGKHAVRDKDLVHRTRLLVTDYYLPDTNGVDLIQLLRAIRPTLPALVITGSKEKAVMERILALSRCHLLHKPLGIDELEHAIHQCLA